MKILLPLLLLGLMIPNRGDAKEECESITGNSITTQRKLAEEAFELTAKLAQTQKVLDVTVTKFGTNQGRGSVSVIIDDEGNLAGVRVDFNLNGQKDTMIKTFEELKEGEKLAYTEDNAPRAALIVKKASDSNIYPVNGGEFTFSILSKKPNSYQHHSLFLRKVDGNWVVKSKAGSTLKKVDLNPNTSGFDWNGTFSEADFD